MNCSPRCRLSLATVRTGDPAITNWLPFRWAGFRQTTRYTIRSRTSASWTTSGAAPGQCAHRRSQGHQSLRSTATSEPVRLSTVPERTRQADIRAPAHPVPVQRPVSRGARCTHHSEKNAAIFIAEDEQGRAPRRRLRHLGLRLRLVLIGGGDPSLRNGGATSFLHLGGDSSFSRDCERTASTSRVP